MSLFKDVRDELRRRAERDQKVNRASDGRVMQHLLDIADCTTEVAGEMRYEVRVSRSCGLVTAALRVRRQTMVNLLRERRGSGHGEVVGSIFDGCEALCYVTDETAELMTRMAKGEVLPATALVRLHEAVDNLTSWVTVQSGGEPLRTSSSCPAEGEARHHWCIPCQEGVPGDCEVFGLEATG